MYAVVKGNAAAARANPIVCTLTAEQVTAAIDAIDGPLDGYWVLVRDSDNHVWPSHTAREWRREMT